MATRNLYLKLSKAFQGKETLLKKSLFITWLGGFILIVILSQVTGNPQLVVGIGVRVWFSICILLGVIYMAVANFNPDRDAIDKSPKESWAVIVLNAAVIMAVYIWFMRD